MLVPQGGGDVQVGTRRRDHPDQRMAYLARELDESVLGAVHPVETFGMGHPAQCAVLAVGPIVVGAAEHPLAPGLGELDLRTAVTAHIGERADGAVGLLHEEQRRTHQVGRHEAAGLLELVEMGHDVRESTHHREFLARQFRIVEDGERNPQEVVSVIGRIVVDMGDQPLGQLDLLFAFHGGHNATCNK